jgi:hypothetical protein
MRVDTPISETVQLSAKRQLREVSASATSIDATMSFRESVATIRSGNVSDAGPVLAVELAAVHERDDGAPSLPVPVRHGHIKREFRPLLVRLVDEALHRAPV